MEYNEESRKLLSVCQRYKFRKQFTTFHVFDENLERCYQSVKDINFESNSQQFLLKLEEHLGCYQSVKDINFESNSQQP